jgi:hypothetical protein
MRTVVRRERVFRGGGFVVAALALHSAPAHALVAHYLTAQPGTTSALYAESSSALDVFQLDTIYEAGGVGGGPTGMLHTASVDTAAGELDVASSVNWTATPLFNVGFTRSLARLEERLYPDPGGDAAITMHVTLQLDASAIVSAGASSVELGASLQFGDCVVQSTRVVDVDSDGGADIGSTCVDTPDVTYAHAGSLDALEIVATYPASPAQVDIGAQLSGDYGGLSDGLYFGTIAAFHHAGRLSIEVTGGNPSYYHSETFLTVPEPDAVALALAAVAALACASRSGAARV